MQKVKRGQEAATTVAVQRKERIDGEKRKDRECLVKSFLKSEEDYKTCQV